jgi:lipopolysaccharide transport system permease protein
MASKDLTTQGMSAKIDLVIEPGSGFRHYWRDLWQYRELFYFLSWRDILVRYKQTAIGIAWGILRPLLTMIVFTIIFGYLAKLPSEGVPYPILVFAAMLPWQFFSSSLTECSNSFITNANMLTKIYFPRLIVPASAVIVNLVDFFISFAILAGLMAWYQFVPGWRVLTLPMFLGMAFLASFGLGLWLATLNVKFRDFRYVVPFIVQFGLYISPVGFSSSVVPGKWRLLYSINPMVGVIDGFRWAILGGNSHIYWPGFLISSAFTLAIFLLAVRYFRSTERKFADII